jgi:hypothetical protein
MFLKTHEGSTGRLLQLCLGYFFFYIITGFVVKLFLGSGSFEGMPGVGGMEYLVYSTIGGNLVCLIVVIVCKWYKFQSNNYVSFAGIKFPFEFLYIIPSGVCTAVVIPTTTLMYSLPITVMVAMVIMRGSIIIISRIIDGIQIKQGILKKKVYMEEELGVVFAMLAVGVPLVYKSTKGIGFDFIHSPAAVGILTSYLTAYAIRLYLMNYFKNTRGKGVKQDNKGYFAIEQIASSITMLVVCLVFFYLVKSDIKQIVEYQQALSSPTKYWGWEILAGTSFGMVAFFSVFLFMFKGRTATFAGLANRLTSLVAGTCATLIFAYSFGGSKPKIEDWVSLIFIFVAVWFMTRAEKKRAAELKQAHEIE